MKNTKHTPGPWHFGPTAGHHDFAIYPEATGKDLALSRGTNEANARLIAAAPELLEALKTMADGYHRGDFKHAVHQDAIAAIAKATGESQ